MAATAPEQAHKASTSSVRQDECMPVVTRIVKGFGYCSILLSALSGALSLVQYCRADEDKVFVIFTTTPALSVIAGFLAILVLVYDSLKRPAVPTIDWATLALAFATYWLSGFVLRDFVSRYPVWH